MSELKRHMGKIKNTDRRCVVVYMQIPSMEDHALVVDSDSLPDSFHEWVMEVVCSSEGQNEPVIANVLNRRPSPDSGLDLLNSMHRRGLLQRQHIDNIVMCPHPSVNMPLRQIIEMNGGKVPQAVSREPVVSKEQADRYNRVAENQRASIEQDQEDIAASVLAQADMMESEVRRKREEAYRLAPHLRPRNAMSANEPTLVAPTRVTESAVPAPAHVDPLITPELQEIASRAQEHLDRAAYREDHPHAVQRVSETTGDSAVKRSRGRPRKNAAA